MMILYDTRLTYPSHYANALQTIYMADAFSKFCPTTLIVNDLLVKKEDLCNQYGRKLNDLNIFNMGLNKIPFRLKNIIRFIKFSIYLAFNYYSNRDKKKIIYIRRPKDLSYWAEKRRRGLFKNWIICYELHDFIEMHDPDFDIKYLDKLKNKYLDDLMQFDIIITLSNRGLKMLNDWSENKLNAITVPHASPLENIKEKEHILHKNYAEFRIGYLGSIDLKRGVDTVINCMDFLSDKFKLILIGKIILNEESQEDISCLEKKINYDENIYYKESLGVKNIAREIDMCDVMIAPGTKKNVFSSEFTTPLKVYDYLVRGKPIIAADTNALLSILSEYKSASFYKCDDPKDLADTIHELADNFDKRKGLAQYACHSSDNYSYCYRAEKIIEIFNNLPNL